MSASAKSNQKNPGIPVTEWIAAAIGALLTFGAIGFLAVDAIRDPGRPADIVVEIDTIAPVSGGWLVQVHAVNRGDEPAAGIEIEAELESGGPEPERSSFTIEFLPSGSVARGGFFFEEDPRARPLTLRALGYHHP